jgi:tetratricopeptide (TPR) repeat protein
VISLAMIVKDEDAHLPGCLDSIAGAVDEIVIVDTGSSDSTPDLARARGCRVVFWPWRDDFAAARNESLRHARGDWVLVLDADERLAPGANRLRDAVKSTRAEGLNCRLVSTLPPGQPAPVIAAWYCRLFRRRPAYRFAGRVHEQIAPSIIAAGGRIEPSPVTINHLGYATPSPEKVARNLRLLRRQLEEHPQDAFALFNLGLTLQSAGEWSQAAEAFERAIAGGTSSLARDLRAMAWTKLAEGRLAQRRWVEAARAAEKALGEEPGLALTRYVLGRALFETDEIEGAAALFAALIDAPPDALGMTLHRHLPAMALALCHLRQRRFADAVTVLAPSAAADASGESAFHLGNAYVGLGRLDDAVENYRASRTAGLQHPDLDRRLKLCQRLGAGSKATPHLSQATHE